MNALWFSALALLPLALGTAPPAADTMRVALCAGGEARTVNVPIPGKAPAPPATCAMKACHAGCQRKQIDRAQ